MKKTKDKIKKGSVSIIKAEILKNIRIIFRGPTRTLFILSLLFPITYLIFMNLIFGAVNFNYPLAVVIPDYASNNELNNAFNNHELNNTQEFLSYINNNDLVGKTIVKSHIEFIGTTEEEFEDRLKSEEIVMIAILPENFETIISDVKNNSWSGGKIIIKLRCLNINEDYLKNLYFGFQRKLKAYYDTVLKNETEITYSYSDADPDRVTFPRMWTIGVGALGFVALVASMIIGSAFVFNEKINKMAQELALSPNINLYYTYIGKVLSTTILSLIINFSLGATIIFLWIGLPFPINFLGFLLIVLGTIVLGSVLGTIFGMLIPEQVFTFPISMFFVLATLFLCGGFINIELFGQPLRFIVELIPFTYCFSILNNMILTGNITNIAYIFGLTIYIAIFFGLGLIFYKKRITSSKFLL
ncbi:MAG: ABC transporter permease [Candidatus Hermodarchaeota archaeon]